MTAVTGRKDSFPGLTVTAWPFAASQAGALPPPAFLVHGPRQVTVLLPPALLLPLGIPRAAVPSSPAAGPGAAVWTGAVARSLLCFPVLFWEGLQSFGGFLEKKAGMSSCESSLIPQLSSPALQPAGEGLGHAANTVFALSASPGQSGEVLRVPVANGRHQRQRRRKPRSGCCWRWDAAGAPARSLPCRGHADGSSLRGAVGRTRGKG